MEHAAVIDMSLNGIQSDFQSFAAKFGVFLGGFGIMFSLITIFLPPTESAELRYMKQQFQIVNDKLDRIDQKVTAYLSALYTGTRYKHLKSCCLFLLQSCN